MQEQFSFDRRQKEEETIFFLIGFGKVNQLQHLIETLQQLPLEKKVIFDCSKLQRIDTAFALYLLSLETSRNVIFKNLNERVVETISLVKNSTHNSSYQPPKETFLEKLGKSVLKKWNFLLELLSFIGMLFVKKIALFFSWKNFRYKEILYEVHQSAVRAIGIVALTSFLVGVVVAYQSAVQLKMYGANIFIVDMLGISILRELAPMLTAIVIAGRSGSAYTAEIGAMKITQELDAMRTMGFDPYYFLVIPRIIALSIALPILIFIADLAGVFGGMLIAHTQLDISFGLFVDRFVENVDFKHFVIGVLKGPFFAFLITTIAIYRGFMVKDDTQSIGKNTTKSVVESIFAVIVCDALFSIVFTNLGL